MHDIGHGQAVGGAAVVGGPGPASLRVEVFERLFFQGQQVTLGLHAHAGIKGSAENQITCAAGGQPGFQPRIVGQRFFGFELQLDPGVLPLKGRYQDFVPENLVVLAPALKRQFLAMRGAQTQCRADEQGGA